MRDRLYVRPVGMLYGEVGRAAIKGGHAGALTGGRIAFTSAELISGTPRTPTTQTASYKDLIQSSEPAIVKALDLITAPRAPIAGISLETPAIMGVVNVTPDSFSDGGLYDETELAISRAAQLAQAGADIIDIGGESTRPGADPVDLEDELKRVIPVITGLKGGPAKLSIDTRKAAVMEAAKQAGVHIFNDVSALTHDPASIDVAAECDLPIVLMHARGDPKTMQSEPVYDNVLLEVFDYLATRIAQCEAAGISRDRLIADPGIGFGKRSEHNLALFAGLSLFHALGVPLLLGASRKSFIGALTGEKDPRQREAGSIAAALAGIAQGVHIIRVHEVAATAQALAVWQAVTSGKTEEI